MYTESKQAYKHVIFNPEQAIPRFIVSYRLVDFQVDAVESFGEEQALTNGGVCRLPLMPSSNFEAATLEELLFRRAESQFLRMFDYNNSPTGRKREVIRYRISKPTLILSISLHHQVIVRRALVCHKQYFSS